MENTAVAVFEKSVTNILLSSLFLFKSKLPRCVQCEPFQVGNCILLTSSHDFLSTAILSGTK